MTQTIEHDHTSGETAADGSAGQRDAPCPPVVDGTSPTNGVDPTTDGAHPPLAELGWHQIADLVRAEAEGRATEAATAALEADRPRWRMVLMDLLDETEDRLDAVRQLPGPERRQVVADFQAELDELGAAFERLTGAPASGQPQNQRAAGDDQPPPEPEPVALQLSWANGNVVAWASGAHNQPDDLEGVRARLEAAGAPASAWSEHRPVGIPGGTSAPSLTADVGDVLGWLVALGAAAADATEGAPGTDPAGEPSPPDPLGRSTRWLSLVSVSAVELVAQGRFVPRLSRSRKRRNKKNKGDRADFTVQWIPGVISQDRIKALADSLPGSVTAADPGPDARAVVQGALSGMVNAIVASAARRLDVPAPPPDPRSKLEVAEAFLAHLGGQQFQASANHGSELARRLEQWARPVTAVARYALIAQLDEPDDAGAWHLRVLSPGPENALDPVEVALVSGSNTRRTEVKDQLARMERLLPALLRPGGKRRGEVILSQDEAWDLMSVTGPALEAAGFEVRVPALSRRKPAASLRLTAEDTGESVVGAQQLTAVSWSAVFGDVELTAAEVARLALEARPLVQSRGKWIALDHADLAEAAAALAERSETNQLTGAEMLRHALGLEGGVVSGGVSIAGAGWAADLLRAATRTGGELETQPPGFSGELRSYQADAYGWLTFLDGAGLGGCLALDMGLGKTPTVLARVGATVGAGPALVVAPPAVVGNWAAEAARFTPDIAVTVHHGPNRASGSALRRRVEKADLVITTYGTAVRDIDQLADVRWDRVVLDEAQVIKNHTSETARQLRKLDARMRLALTGTPIENGLGDLWAIMDFCNPGLVGERAPFIGHLSKPGDARGAAESALHALNGVLVFRRTKAEPAIAAELPDRIDELAHCTMTPEQIGLYQAVLDKLVRDTAESESNTDARKGAVLAAITALKQICNHPLNYQPDDPNTELDGRSGKLKRLNEILEVVFAAGERVLIFTHFATWGERLAAYLSSRHDLPIECYHGGLGRSARDRLVEEFQNGEGPGAMVLSLKAGGTGLNLTAASQVVLYDRWWNPAVEDQARDRVWRIGQTKTVICHRLVCPGTVDERVEEVVQGKRQIADMVLPKSSSIGDLDAEQLRAALGINEEAMLAADDDDLDDDGTRATADPAQEVVS
jgi:superfamily II DNA or RNA helicase